ncbi:MAG: polyprenyl synthetase family protein [Elusimicrobia bacterium]|nr:polyprenyl synthetase family protein [Elusimicrobiota bacterium]
MGTSCSDFDLKKYLPEKTIVINIALNKYLQEQYPPLLYKAMRYSIFAGGKRLRPFLVLEGARVCGGDEKKVMPTACALEYIHTYSLIHDDLPAMDNDDYRRGRLTSHKKFGEDVAILAGDALLTEAFGLLAANAAVKGIKIEQVLNVITLVSGCAGGPGMIGGQLIDTRQSSDSSQEKISAKKQALTYIHNHKTVALIKASLLAGAILAKASSRQLKALTVYAEKIGLSFQIMDDVLDVIGNKKKLGKTGSDRQNKKLTYVSLYGLEWSQKEAAQLIAEAKKAITTFGRKKYILAALADYIVEREY